MTALIIQVLLLPFIFMLTLWMPMVISNALYTIFRCLGGQQQTDLIYWIFQGFFIAVILCWFVVTFGFLMSHAIKYFTVKEETERKSFWKTAKAPIISGLILIGAIIFIEVGWNVIAPIIWKAVS